MIAGLAISGVVLITLVSLFFMSMSYKNTAVDLRLKFEASQKDVRLTHTNMWQTIKQKVAVNDEYQKAFIEVVKETVKGRTGGALFKSVTEGMPGLPADTYKMIMATIEGKRDELKNKQEIMVDVAKDYNALLEKPWSGFWCGLWGERTKLEAEIMTSSATEKAWETKKDDDISIR